MAKEIAKKKTTVLTREQAIKQRQWYIVDAENQVLGRLATKVAHILRGKLKVDYTPNQDCGDFVVIINSDKIRFTGGNKALQKKYFAYSGYAGGMKETSLEKQMMKDSRKVILAAVGGMLPKSRLANKQLTKCKVYKDAAHDHIAQQPKTLKI
jgi:large subunit ribosomal protein L13